MAVIVTFRVSASCVTGRNAGILLSSLDIFLIINDLCFFLELDNSYTAIGSLYEVSDVFCRSIPYLVFLPLAYF
mgnify:CR=1 FL=1